MSELGVYVSPIGADKACDEILEDNNDYMGPVFEKICTQYLVRATKAGLLPFIPYKLGKWWGNNPVMKAQDDVDILAVDKSGQRAMFCECKFKNKAMPMEECDDLITASQCFSDIKEKHYCFISKSGFTEPVKERAAREGAKLLILSDLYKDRL